MDIGQYGSHEYVNRIFRIELIFDWLTYKRTRQEWLTGTWQLFSSEKVASIFVMTFN